MDKNNQASVRKKASVCKEKNERSENVSRQQEKKNGKKDSFDVENLELTEKQQLFCTYYVRCFNAAKAYQKVHGCSYNTARTEDTKNFTKPDIRKEIWKLKQDKG